jgi:hypothetical protein
MFLVLNKIIIVIFFHCDLLPADGQTLMDHGHDFLLVFLRSYFHCDMDVTRFIHSWLSVSGDKQTSKQASNKRYYFVFSKRTFVVLLFIIVKRIN